MLPLGLTCLAAFGFVLEILVVIEVLLTRCEDEIRATVHALQHSVLEFRHGLFTRYLPVTT